LYFISGGGVAVFHLLRVAVYLLPTMAVGSKALGNFEKLKVAICALWKTDS